jgi:hypothetical protein
MLDLDDVVLGLTVRKSAACDRIAGKLFAKVSL